MGFIRLQCSRCGNTHVMEYSARNVLKAVRSGWNSCGSALYCPDCAKTWEERNGDRKLCGEEHTVLVIDIIYRRLEPKTVTEYCSECGSEIMLFWDVNRDGYKAYCPVCGAELMLCDECTHRAGECAGDCDYNKNTGACRFNPMPRTEQEEKQS